jgi:hypothetical protein
MTVEEARELWNKLLRDPKTRDAIRKLEQAGFQVSEGQRRDIIAIPSLPNRRAKSKALHPPKGMSVVSQFVRELAAS